MTTSTPAPAPTGGRAGAATGTRGSRWRGLLTAPAAPAFLGVVVVWLAAWLLAGQGFVGTLAVAAGVAGFLVLVGIGQLFVITTGDGSIDLSVPYTMTLGAYLSCIVMDGSNAMLVPGVLIAVATGLVVASVNAFFIEVVGMPPLVATLAVGLLIQTVNLVYASTRFASASPVLVDLVNLRLGPVPLFAFVGLLATVVFAFLLKRTSFGRQVEAVGQNATAAALSGLRPRWVRARAYAISGVLASVAGMLLASYAGGPSLDLGTPYLLSSIAAVVLGGSLIAGGRSSVPGVWAAGVLLTLIITLVNVADVSYGVQYVVQGVLIILVLSVSRVPVGRR